MATRTARSNQTVSSAERTLVLLEAFSDDDRELGIKELSQRSGLSPSTTHRLITVLWMRGYIRQNPHTKKYTLGLRLLELGSRVLEQMDLRSIARPYLERLSDETGETCLLAIPEDAGLIYIDQVCRRSQDVTLHVRVGSHGQIHCTASGKVMMAHQSDERVAELFSAYARQFTDRTIVDLHIYLAQLREIRGQGYAVGRGEWRDEVSGAAAPVFGHIGQAIASVSVVGLTSRIDAQLQPLVDAVVRAAADISREMGYGGVRGLINRR